MAGDFVAGFSVGAVAGATLTEILKALGGHFIKQRFDSRADKRKLLREDAGKLADSAEALTALAFDYYGKPSADVQAEARQIRAGLKTLGVHWNTLSMRSGELDLTPLQAQHLIRFRQALTSELDVERQHPLSIDSDQVRRVFGAFSSLSDALSALRYQAA